VHKVRTARAVATRVQYIIAFEEACRRYPGLSARRFCAVAEIPYSTFARWWARWQRDLLRFYNRTRLHSSWPSGLSLTFALK